MRLPDMLNNSSLSSNVKDALVNATNPNLHPGYTGDGIGRRIREKAGKQMHDACKRIIKQEAASGGKLRI